MSSEQMQGGEGEGRREGPRREILHYPQLDYVGREEPEHSCQGLKPDHLWPDP
jgi:hypothetical protein